MTNAVIPTDAGHPSDPEEVGRERCFAVDVAKTLGVSYEAVHKFRRISLAEGGAGPVGLPPRDGYVANWPWWYRETIIWWGTATGRLHPYTGEPQRLPQAVAIHPRRPTVRVWTGGRPRGLVIYPARLFRWLDDDTPLYLEDIADLSGYPLDTVKRNFRRASIAEGGMGPHGLPDPDGYDKPARRKTRPWRPRWRAGTVRWWLIATGRMSPVTGEPIPPAQRDRAVGNGSVTRQRRAKAVESVADGH